MLALSSSKKIDCLYEHLKSGFGLVLCTFVNAFSYYDLSDDMVEEIDYFFSDGILLTKLNNFFFNDLSIDRVSFDSTSLAYPFFKFCENEKLRIGLVGATQEEIENFVNFIKTRFPSLNVYFYSSGYGFDEEVVLSNSLFCDVVVVGMGFPNQERFLLKVKDRYSQKDNLKVAITCGGFFSQHQHKDYYPKFVDKLNIRWLYRLLFTKHVFKKVIKKYPSFLFRYIYNALF